MRQLILFFLVASLVAPGQQAFASRDNQWSSEEVASALATFALRYRLLHDVRSVEQVPQHLSTADFLVSVPLHRERGEPSDSPIWDSVLELFGGEDTRPQPLAEAIYQQVAEPGLEVYLQQAAAEFDTAFIGELGFEPDVAPSRNPVNQAVIQMVLNSIPKHSDGKLRRLAIFATSKTFDLESTTRQARATLAQHKAFEQQLLAQNGGDLSQAPLAAMTEVSVTQAAIPESEFDPYKGCGEEFEGTGQGWCGPRAFAMQDSLQDLGLLTLRATIEVSGRVFKIPAASGGLVPDPHLSKSNSTTADLRYRKMPDKKVLPAPQAFTAGMIVKGVFSAATLLFGYHPEFTGRQPTPLFFTASKYGQVTPIPWELYLSRFVDADELVFRVDDLPTDTLAAVEDYLDRRVEEILEQQSAAAQADRLL